MTYGERAVGLSFNPSGNTKVDKLKRPYAEIIDLCLQEGERARSEKFGYERARMSEIAIREAQTAQMWAVKTVTWKDQED